MIAMGQRLTAEQFLQFNEHMLGLVNARVPLDEGLRQMVGEIERGRLQNFVASVAEQLESGRQLSEALEPYRPQLSDYYIALLRAGEAGGALAEILHHVVSETRRQIDHRRAVATSLIYPTVVFVFAVAIFAVVCVTMVPQLVDVFRQMGADLPGPTLFVVNVAIAVRDSFLWVAGAVVVVVAAVALAPPLRSLRDALLLNLPIVGRMVYDDVVISFARCLGFLLERKVAMADALTLTQSILRNVIARRFVAHVREGVEQGRSLSEMLEQYRYIPPSTRWMIRLAEDRGDLEQTLADLADFYQAKQEQVRRTVRGLIEPVMIAVLGLVIGTIIIALYLPLFTIPKVLV